MRRSKRSEFDFHSYCNTGVPYYSNIAISANKSKLLIYWQYFAWNTTRRSIAIINKINYVCSGAVYIELFLCVRVGQWGRSYTKQMHTIVYNLGSMADVGVQGIIKIAIFHA